MKKNICIVVLLGAVVVLAVVVAKQHQQIAQLQESPVASIAPPPPALPPTRQSGQPAPATQLAPPVEPIVPPPSPTSGVATDESAKATGNYFAGLAKMMKDPAMKDMIRAQQKMMLDRMYGPLPKYLDLPADKLNALKELLADRQAALSEAGIALMSGTDAERKQAAVDATTTKADYDKEIQELLGAKDYETFQQYESTMGERTQVQMFKDSLSAEVALTDEQEDQLITAMYEERMASPPSALVNNQNNPPDPSQLTEDHIAETLKQLEQTQQRYAERAANILSPAQLEQFKQWQQQWSAMQTMSLKMAAQMFGNKAASPAPAPSPTSTP